MSERLIFLQDNPIYDVATRQRMRGASVSTLALFNCLTPFCALALFIASHGKLSFTPAGCLYLAAAGMIMLNSVLLVCAMRDPAQDSFANNAFGQFVATGLSPLTWLAGFLAAGALDIVLALAVGFPVLFLSFLFGAVGPVGLLTTIGVLLMFHITLLLFAALPARSFDMASVLAVLLYFTLAIVPPVYFLATGIDPKEGHAPLLLAASNLGPFFPPLSLLADPPSELQPLMALMRAWPFSGSPYNCLIIHFSIGVAFAGLLLALLVVGPCRLSPPLPFLKVAGTGRMAEIQVSISGAALNSDDRESPCQSFLFQENNLSWIMRSEIWLRPILDFVFFCLAFALIIALLLEAGVRRHTEIGAAAFFVTLALAAISGGFNACHPFGLILGREKRTSWSGIFVGLLCLACKALAIYGAVRMVGGRLVQGEVAGMLLTATLSLMLACVAAAGFFSSVSKGYSAAWLRLLMFVAVWVVALPICASLVTFLVGVELSAIARISPIVTFGCVVGGEKVVILEALSALQTGALLIALCMTFLLLLNLAGKRIARVTATLAVVCLPLVVGADVADAVPASGEELMSRLRQVENVASELLALEKSRSGSGVLDKLGVNKGFARSFPPLDFNIVAYYMAILVASAMMCSWVGIKASRHLSVRRLTVHLSACALLSASVLVVASMTFRQSGKWSRLRVCASGREWDLRQTMSVTARPVEFPFISEYERCWRNEGGGIVEAASGKPARYPFLSPIRLLGLREGRIRKESAVGHVVVDDGRGQVELIVDRRSDLKGRNIYLYLAGASSKPRKAFRCQLSEVEKGPARIVFHEAQSLPIEWSERLKLIMELPWHQAAAEAFLVGVDEFRDVEKDGTRLSTTEIWIEPLNHQSGTIL